MRRTTHTAQPRIIMDANTDINNSSAPNWLLNILKNLMQFYGIGICMQDEEGGIVTVRFNRQTKAVEYWDGELWR